MGRATFFSTTSAHPEDDSELDGEIVIVF
jgi:hypothetical protein